MLMPTNEQDAPDVGAGTRQRSDVPAIRGRRHAAENEATKGSAEKKAAENARAQILAKQQAQATRALAVE